MVDKKLPKDEPLVLGRIELGPMPSKEPIFGPDPRIKDGPSRKSLQAKIALAISIAKEAQHEMEVAHTPLKEKNAGWYGLRSVIEALE